MDFFLETLACLGLAGAHNFMALQRSQEMVNTQRKNKGKGGGKKMKMKKWTLIAIREKKEKKGTE